MFVIYLTARKWKQKNIFIFEKYFSVITYFFLNYTESLKFPKKFSKKFASFIILTSCNLLKADFHTLDLITINNQYWINIDDVYN